MAPFIKQARPRRRQTGFTLPETLMAMGLAGLVAITLAAILMFSGRSFAGLFNYVDLDDVNRIAMDILTRDIRTANRMLSFKTNEFVLEDMNKTPITYHYDANERTLTRVTTNYTRVLLTDCERFGFTVGQRTPEGGNYEVFPTADANNAKVVNLSWVCSRKIGAIRANTESVQTARIIIRRQGHLY